MGPSLAIPTTDTLSQVFLIPLTSQMRGMYIRSIMDMRQSLRKRDWPWTPCSSQRHERQMTLLDQGE